jgi:arsenite transporter
MSVGTQTAGRVPATSTMSVFERYLSVWVLLCIVAGIALGQFAPNVFQAIGRMEIAQVNLPVGLLIWIMIVPMLLKVDFGALGQVAGLILLAAAPCTAMVFVWSRLTGGDPVFTLSQVALNDTIMVFAFAPIVGLLLGLSSITVPWATLLVSVGLYIVIPVILAQLWRRALLNKGQAAFDRALERIGPLSIAALLLTLVLLFAFQGEAIIRQPLVIAMLAVPILIQVFFNSGLAYWLSRKAGEQHSIACPSALIGASNFFELAVAAAISLFGFQSGAALATVVGVLIEVPVMLLVVRIVNQSKGWYECGPNPARR